MVFILRKRSSHRPALRSGQLSEPLLGPARAACDHGDAATGGGKVGNGGAGYGGKVGGGSGGSGGGGGSRGCAQGELIGASLRRQLLSAPFAEVSASFATSALFYQTFLGSLGEQAQATIRQRQPLLGDEEASALAASYVSTFLSLAPLGALLNAPLGYCIDRLGFEPMLAVTLLAGAGHALALYYGAFAAGAAAFLLLTAASFSYMYAFLAFTFGFEYYGLLAGIAQSVASAATFALQPRLHAAAAGPGGWRRVQLAQAAAFACLAVGIVGGRLLCRRAGGARRRAGHSFAGSPQATSRRSEARPAERSYSAGDLHATPSSLPFRRRPDLFPHADDILVMDGALAHYSHAAYRLEASIESPGRDGRQGQQLTPSKFASQLAVAAVAPPSP